MKTAVRALPALAARPAVLHDARALGRTVLGIAIGLTAFGLVMIYSWTAVKFADRRPRFDPDAVLRKQVVWALLASAVGFVVSRVPLGWLRKRSTLLLGGLLVLLALTLVPGVGVLRNRSRRWLELGPFTLQASEFLKLAVIVYLADRLARREEEPLEHRTPWPALLAPVGLGVGLILAQPDLGTSLFVACLGVVLLGLAGIRFGKLLPLALVAIPLIVAFAAANFRHVGERLEFFTKGVEADEQQWRGVVALGSGGVLGTGLGAGTQKLGRVAEMQNDFIFTLIGEELGFVGCAAVVVAFMALVLYGKRIAERAHASAGLFPFFLACGATFAVAFQALINIAVATGSAPNKGVSLPFISVGGSSLVTAFASVGLLVNVARTVAQEEAGDPWS
ncbi:MAG: cell division protein FtsW [Planctomycetes bacterium]|nr:cell division protein FtsW [Planctomycetota bacterium]